MTPRLAAVFHAVGVCFVVLGGLVAAATRPLGVELGSWLAAYLVLVCGVGLAVMGRAQQRFAPTPVPDRTAWGQFALWNAGNACVVVGTLATVPAVVDVGGVLLLPPLLFALRSVARSRGSLLVWLYRAGLVVLLVSIPVGLVLGHLRA